MRVKKLITQVAIVIVSQIVVARGITTRRPAIRSFFKSCFKRWITEHRLSLQWLFKFCFCHLTHWYELAQDKLGNLDQTNSDGGRQTSLIRDCSCLTTSSCPSEAVLVVEGSISICKACKELLQVSTSLLQFSFLQVWFSC